ncbi:hypothetical protein BHE74_00029127 [Ensete ventricosum]|nr:hypothetical protein BHE74_00029127 [Ensete ventricosum]
MSYEHGFVKNGIVINLAQSLVSASSQNFKILDIPNILARGKLYGHGFAKKRDVTCKFEFLSIFYAPSRNFKILAIPNVLANGNSYEHDFTKKCDSHNLCTKSRAKMSSISFSCSVSEFQNIGHSQRVSPSEVVRAWFRK